jgi:hypothetical protein
VSCSHPGTTTTLFTPGFFFYFFFSFSLSFLFLYPNIFPVICELRARTLASGPKEKRSFLRDFPAGQHGQDLLVAAAPAGWKISRNMYGESVTEVSESGLGKFILPSGLHQVNIKSLRCDVGQHRTEVRKLLLNREPESVILIQEGVVFDGKRVKSSQVSFAMSHQSS